MQQFLGRIILLAAAVSYVSLAIYVSVVTLQETAPATAHISAGVAGGFGALATALGAGYATKLGVPVTAPTFASGTGWDAKFWGWIKKIFTTGNAIWLDIFAYFGVGGLLLITYLVRQVQSPGFLKAVAVGFGGYTIAYVTKTLSS
jgi:hypothetical protein